MRRLSFQLNYWKNSVIYPLLAIGSLSENGRTDDATIHPSGQTWWKSKQLRIPRVHLPNFITGQLFYYCDDKHARWCERNMKI